MTAFKPMALLKSFVSSRAGSITPAFAVLAIPLMMLAGFSIDLSRAHEGKAKLQDAVDAAALALAHESPLTPLATMKAQAQNWIAADLHDTDVSTADVDVTSNAGVLIVEAKSEVEAEMAGLIGMNTFHLVAQSTVQWGLSHVEVALVLDNTGSMASNNKLPTLVTAAKGLVQTLLNTKGNDPKAVKISIVPFSMTVNIGSQYQNQPWMTGVMPVAYGPDIFTTPTTDRFALFKAVGKTWGGCVESRPAPYDTQDTPPSPAVPATMIVPYFAPDEPDTGGFGNNYMSDGLPKGTPWQTAQGNVLKYNKAVGSAGPNAGCNIAPVVRLTNNLSTLTSELDQMIASGNTNLEIGMQWGLMALSPNGPFGDGVAYNTPDTDKIIVLLTDGFNESDLSGNADDSFYAGIGYVWQHRLGLDIGSTKAQRDQVLDDRTVQACQNAKANGITVYTVRIDSSGTAPAVLKNCASSPDKFYDVKNVPNLPQVFQQIAGAIGKLRIAN